MSPGAREGAPSDRLAFLLIDVQVNQFDPAYPVNAELGGRARLVRADEVRFE